MTNGLVIIDKPKGYTSHDVVNCVRKIYDTKKVGHTGTLDPDATGVLPICIGNMTRLAEYLTSEDKIYTVEIFFGKETNTLDASGEIINTTSLPKINKTEFERVLQEFIGKQTQIPPMFSAKKINGKPMYKLAREGIVLKEITPIEIEVISLNCLSFSQVSAKLMIHCSKGTYIRTLASDISRKIGTCGYINNLRRIQSGSFSIEKSVSLDVLKLAEIPRQVLISPIEAMKNYPQIYLNPASFNQIRHGNSICVNTNIENTLVHVASYKGELVAVGFCIDGVFKPKKVFIR